ncbi:DNA-binding transcriptional LysR family regulator [Marinobacter sp. LV10R520-4]|uniref:LysR family transcriptional regulator n=1 Tax=Marinobacter sp. LV10R520-4 TaxID=1761796 RepID=UPI000BF9D134|nr:LysR family transcriptional regulator [Marinobacter sp. LV10R520-4]PFG52571.1 DNA-binding transcriptional LysR family regulator [Marinobacter sp. LV10R520-4]
MKWSLDQLRTFIYVADTGGFSRAGERLFLAQSTVSWQVQQLERQVGSPLLQRNPNGVTLTEKGMAFYLRAQKVVTANDEAELWLTQNTVDRQIIRFATTDCYASCLLPGLLEHWKCQFPNVQVTLDCSFSTGIWERYKKGEFDIALAQHCPSDINAEPIRVEPLEWVCARQSLAWQQSTVPVALFEHGCPDRQIMLSALKGAGREYRVEFETYSYGGLVAAVESGAVVSALPRSTIPSTLKRLDSQHRLPRLPSLNVNLASPNKNSNAICGQLYDAVMLYLAKGSPSLRKPLKVATHST